MAIDTTPYLWTPGLEIRFRISGHSYEMNRLKYQTVPQATAFVINPKTVLKCIFKNLSRDGKESSPNQARRKHFKMVGWGSNFKILSFFLRDCCNALKMHILIRSTMIFKNHCGGGEAYSPSHTHTHTHTHTHCQPPSPPPHLFLRVCKPPTKDKIEPAIIYGWKKIV